MKKEKSLSNMKLLTESDVAEQLKISVATLRRWRKDKTGPPVIKTGRYIKYFESDVISWLEDNRENEE